jgi:hypothetical protein
VDRRRPCRHETGCLNPEALWPVFKTWTEGLRKAGLDIPNDPAADN